MLKKLGGYALTGLMVVAPWVITIWLVITVFNWFDAVTGPIGRWIFGPSFPYLIGPLLAVLGLIALGWMVNRRIVRWFVSACENVVKKFPVVGVVFKLVKDTVEAIEQTSNVSRFSRVVLIQPFRPGVEMIGLVTFEGKTASGRTLLAVVAPSALLPSAGLLFLVYEDQTDLVRESPLSVEDALRSLISGGMALSLKGPMLDLTSSPPSETSDPKKEDKDPPLEEKSPPPDQSASSG